MIVAYCDSCGDQVDPDVSAGVRYLIGKQEWSGHLCERCQGEALSYLSTMIHAKHSLRKVK